MSRWDDVVTRTDEEATQFWADASLDQLAQMMAPPWAWEAWLRVASGVVTTPGSVFEPGCGVGLLVDVLPPGCTYYGCDVNPTFVEHARRARSRPGVSFEVRDLHDVLQSGRTFDWVVVTSLFGMYPESSSYDVMDACWQIARRGLSVTTINKKLYRAHRLLRFDFTAHDPGQLEDHLCRLPGVGRVELHHGREFPEFRGHHWARGLAAYAWREHAVRHGDVPRSPPAESPIVEVDRA